MDTEGAKFIESCHRINSVCSQITEKEVVSDEMAFTSEVIFKNMKVDGIGDALLFVSALNVLNTFVKQSKENKKTLGYSFKKGVDIIFKYMLEHPSEMMRAEIQKDGDESIAFIEINSIQFSFHNVTLTDSSREFIVKDPEHPEIQWDGIRKQMCSVTLMQFAQENEYDRTNRMLDGSDFQTGCDTLLEQYRNGTMTLEDSKKTYYGKGGQQSAKNAAKEEKDYPLRNRSFSVLYQADARSFVENTANRRLLKYLISAYEEGTGFKLGPVERTLWKYAFEAMYCMFLNMEISEEAAMAVLHIRMLGQEYPMLIIDSADKDGVQNFALIQLLSWNRMKLTEQEKVEYCQADTEESWLSLHPSDFMAQIGAMIKESFGVSLETRVFPCTYFYDAVLEEDTDIVTGFPEEKYNRAPIFYANDRVQMAYYLSAAASGYRGKELLGLISRSNVEPTNCGMPLDVRIAVNTVLGKQMKENEKFVFILNVRRAFGDTSFKEYLDGCVKENGEESVEVYYDEFPDVWDDHKAKVVVVCDLDGLNMEETEEYAEMLDDCSQAGIGTERIDPLYCAGFSDFGVGINWLVARLQLGTEKVQRFFPDMYSIRIAEAESDFEENEGIANVIIPETYRYDGESETVAASEEDRQELYSCLIKGRNGVHILCRDQELRELLYDGVNENNELIISGNYVNQESLTKEDARAIRNKVKNNSSTYNHYANIAIKGIGISAWKKLTEESRNWVVSALTSYEKGKAVDPQMDFSGVALMMSKTFETELGLRLGSEYMEYMKKKYGDAYIDHLPKDLYEIKNDEKKPVDPTKLMLGSMPFVMGVDSRGRVVDQAGHEEFIAYAEDELFAAKDQIEKDIRTLVDIIYYVRVNFRNTSAHKEAIDLLVAADCVEYCVTKKRKLGVTMDIFTH